MANGQRPIMDIQMRSLTPPTTPPGSGRGSPLKLAEVPKPPVAVTPPSSPESPPPQGIGCEPAPFRSKTRLEAVTVIVKLAGISFLNTMGSGILIAALPRIAEDVGLDEGFLLWPASVYALAAGCLLLISGAVADVVGAKRVWVTVSFLYMVFTIGVGLCRTGVQLIVFRTLTSASISMCLPAAVSLITNTFSKDPWRNTAFACNGMGQPLGYAVGLVLGGVFTDTVGWRLSFYVMALINLFIAVSALWALPDVRTPSEKPWRRRLIEDIDWIGAIIMSAALGIQLYVLATTTSSYAEFVAPKNIALFALSLLLLIAFPFWMGFQDRRNRPGIIPNRLWKSAAFTVTCITVFFCWASLNAIEYFTTL